MFQFYNTALAINDECDTEDAMKYVCKQLDLINDSVGDRATGIDIFLKDLFDSK